MKEDMSHPSKKVTMDKLFAFQDISCIVQTPLGFGIKMKLPCEEDMRKIAEMFPNKRRSWESFNRAEATARGGLMGRYHPEGISTNISRLIRDGASAAAIEKNLCQEVIDPKYLQAMGIDSIRPNFDFEMNESDILASAAAAQMYFDQYTSPGRFNYYQSNTPADDAKRMNFLSIPGAPLQPQQQGNTMQVTNTDLNRLAELANLNNGQDDLSQFISANVYAPEELKSVFAEVEAEDKRVKMRSAVDSIRKVAGISAEVKKLTVARIRALRAEEKELLNNLKAIERAEQYGAETMNYLPLSHLVSPTSASVAMRQFVPADWVPKAKASAPEETKETPAA